MKNNFKNVLIIENLDTHAPLIVTFMNLFGINSHIKPFFIITKKNHENIFKNFKDFYKKNEKFMYVYKDVFIKKSGIFYELINSFVRLKETIKVIKKENIDIILLNTPEAKKNIFLMIYFLFSNKKIILNIHDSILDKNLGKMYTFLLKRIIKKSKFLFFLGDYLKEDPIFKNKNKIFINFVYELDEKKFNKYEGRTFVINSSPDIKNRDFYTLFKVFKEILKEIKYKKEIKIILPLKIKSEEIKDLIKKNNLEGVVKIYEEYVSEENLIKTLKKSHYAIIPLYPDTKSGTNRISASVSYACAYKLPFIIPSVYFKNNKKKRKYALLYNFKDESLKNKIKKCIYDKYDEDKISQLFNEYNPKYCFPKINKKINKFLN